MLRRSLLVLVIVLAILSRVPPALAAAPGGPRVVEPGPGLIQGYAYAAPGEDLKLK